MSKNDVPLQRINYFDGLKLTAELLRMEQDYHRQMQRLILSSVVRPGVVKGFNVTDGGAPNGRAQVYVSAGLAVDGDGNAIYLAETRALPVSGIQLYVRYAEERRNVTTGGTCGEEGGAPAVIRCAPEFVWLNSEATERGDLVRLAKILGTCAKVEGIQHAQYSTSVTPPGVRIYCKERDIDKNNPLTMRIPVETRLSRVRIALWGTKFSSLFYSELGSHSHVLGTDATVEEEAPGHWHLITQHNDAGRARDAKYHGVSIRHTKPSLPGDFGQAVLPFNHGSDSSVTSGPLLDEGLPATAYGQMRGSNYPDEDEKDLHLATDRNSPLVSISLSGSTETCGVGPSHPSFRTDNLSYAGDVTINVVVGDVPVNITSSVRRAARMAILGAKAASTELDRFLKEGTGLVRIDDVEELVGHSLLDPQTFTIEVSVADDDDGGGVECQVYLET
jgi:hypothetical protein